MAITYEELHLPWYPDPNDKEDILISSGSENEKYLKELIAQCIRNEKDFRHVKNLVSSQIHRPLSGLEDNYMRRYYVKKCLKFWFKEITSILERIKMKNSEEILKFVEDIENQNYSDLKTKYSDLLFKPDNLDLDQDEINYIMESFQMNVFSSLVQCFKWLENEIQFLNLFSNILSHSITQINKNILTELNSSNSRVDFVAERMRIINDFIIKYEKYHPKDEKLIEYKSMANDLKVLLYDIKNPSNYLVKKLKEMIKKFFEPPAINLIEDSNKNLILEIIGSGLMLSSLLERIESEISKCNELRLISSDYIFIGCDLKGDVWNGKNVVIICKTIVINGENREINLSGRDGEGYKNAPHSCKARDGKSGQNGDHGEDGKDGEPGSSGGNVFIYADHINNSKNLKIISNGGNGGDGQDGADGGKGFVGRDGDQKEPKMWKSKFLQMLPSMGKLFYGRLIPLGIFGETVSESYEQISSSLRELSYNGYSNISKNNYGLYASVETTHGAKVTFKFYNASLKRHSLTLYEGPPGDKGSYHGLGGRKGWGGKPGFAGHIRIEVKDKSGAQLITENHDGDSGSNGKDGKDGRKGRNGKYGTDYALIGYITPFNYEVYKEGCLMIKERDEDTGDSIKCPETDKWIDVIHANRSETIILDTEDNREEKRNQKMAKRTNTINEVSMMQKYKSNLNCATKITFQSEFDIESMMKKVSHLQNQQKQSTQIFVHQNCDFIPNREFEHRVQSIKSLQYGNKICLESSEPATVLSREMVLVKHRFLVLQQISPELSLSYDNLIDVPFLERTSTKDSIFHSLFGVRNSMSVFECENLEELKTKLKEKMKKISTEAFKILGVKDPESHPNKRLMHVFLAAFNGFHYDDDQQNQSNPILPGIISSLIVENQSKGTKLLSFLSSAKDIVGLTMTQVFNYFKQSKIPEEDIDKYIDYICGINPIISIEDIELIAYCFDLKVDLYIFDEHTNQLMFDCALNEEAKSIVRICMSEDFVYSRIEMRKIRDHTNACKVYSKLLEKVDGLDMVSEIYNYFNNKSYLNDCTVSNSENVKEIAAKLDSNPGEYIQKILGLFDSSIKDNIKIYLLAINNFDPILLRILYNHFYIFDVVIDETILCLLSTIVCKISSKDSKIIHWILSAYPQYKWINQFFIVYLEFYFENKENMFSSLTSLKKTVETFNEQLILVLIGQIERDENWREVPKFETILKQLSEIQLSDEQLEELYSVHLDNWSNYINGYKLIKQLERLCNSWLEIHLKKATYYLYSLENENKNLVDKLLKLFENNKNLASNEYLECLSKFYHSVWPFTQAILSLVSNYKLSKWDDSIKEIYGLDNKKAKNFSQIIEIIRNDNNTNLSKQVLTDIESILNKMNNKRKSKILGSKPFIDFKESSDKNKCDFKLWTEKLTEKTKQNDNLHSYLAEILSVINEAINLKKGFYLRDTQKIAVLSIFLNEEKGTLAQMSTGEGKSLVVMALSIMNALKGFRSDIITSSPVLAIRDATENQPILELFNMTADHNTYENIDKRRSAYQTTIVYGDATNFQRDYLLHNYYNENIFGSRSFDECYVIIDEVDSLLLDKGNNVLYLSHECGGLDTLDSLFLYVWQKISLNSILLEETPSIEDIKDSVRREMDPIIDKEDLKLVDSDNYEDIWNSLVDMKFIEKNGKVLKYNDLHFPNGDWKKFELKVEYLLENCFKAERRVSVPSYLREFVDLHLENWITSAFRAIQMVEGDDYNLDIDRSCTRADTNLKIIIIDKDTGVDQNQSQWSEGLHQFLQLKHKCKITPISLKAIFLSNIKFFKMYKYVFGLTGTLGSKVEREFIQNTYHVNFITIPMAMEKRFIEEVPQIYRNRFNWSEAIISHAFDLAKTRSVLVICENVNDVDFLYLNWNKKYGEMNNSIQVHTYKRSYERFSITEDNKVLEKGVIIFATNLAGRGTDIKISDDLNDNGGLHVILSYLPDNLRVELQAYGRAGRKGNRGSAKMIICNQKISNYNNNEFDVINLKMERDKWESEKIKTIKEHFDNVIEVEEKLFEKFGRSYELLKNSLKHMKLEDSVRDLILSTCLDHWSFWLDSNCHKNSKKSDYFEMCEKLSKLTDRMQIKSLDQALELLSNPIQLLQYAKILLIEPNICQRIKECLKDKAHVYDTSIDYFDRIIKNERELCGFAYYYKSLAILKETHLTESYDKKSFKNLLQLSEDYFKAQIDSQQKSISTINQISEFLNMDTKTLVENDCYQTQKSNNIDLYFKFLNSINEIRGLGITPEGISTEKLDTKTGEKLIAYLQTLGVVKRISAPKCEDKFDKEKLTEIAFSRGLQSSKLINVLKSINGLRKSGFRKLKSELKLPFREDFWQQLVDAQILTDEQFFCIVSNEQNDESIKPIESLIKDGILKKKTKLNLSKGYIYLYCENFIQQEMQQKENQNIKSEECNKTVYLISEKYKLTSDSKLQQLSDEGIISLNKSAKYDKTYRHNILENYDLLSHSYLENIHSIDEPTAKNIFNFLVNQKLLTYDGKLLSKNFSNVDFGIYEIYRQDIIAVINTFCCYRISLMEIEEQLEKHPDQIIQIGLKSERNSCPYKSLICSCLDANLLKPDRINKSLELTELKDFEKYLLVKTIIDESKIGFNEGFGSSLKTAFEKFISDPSSLTNIGSSIGSIENPLLNPFSSQLFITKSRIQQYFDEIGYEADGYSKNSSQFISKFWEFLLKMNLISPLNVNEHEINLSIIAFKSILDINDLAKYIVKKNKHEMKVTIPQNIKLEDLSEPWNNEEVLQYLKMLSILSNSEERQLIFSKLLSHRSKLKSLEQPDGDLTTIEDVLSDETKVESVMEIHNFKVNGLDSVITLREAKYTKKWLKNVFICTLLGIIQITGGVLLELFTMGFGTFLGTALISEGISDLMFAGESLASGYFSWRDYRNMKWKSICFSLLTAGVGILLARGIKFSRFGTQIAGETLSKYSGFKLLKAVGNQWTRLTKFMAIRVGLKFAQGISFGVANHFISKLLQSLTTDLCTKMANIIRGNIKQQLKSPDITKSLRVLFSENERNPESITNQIIQSIKTEELWFLKISHSMSQVFCSISSGIGESIQKISRSGNIAQNILTDLAFYLRKFLAYEKYIRTTTEIITTTHEFIDKLIKKLTNYTSAKSINKNIDEAKFDNFQNEFICQIEANLDHRIGSLIEHKLLIPLVQQQTQRILMKIGQQFRRANRWYINKRNRDKLIKIKTKLIKDCESKIEDNSNSDENYSDDIQEDVNRRISEKVIRELVELSLNSKDPDLCAEIVRLGAPIDINGVQSAADILGIPIRITGVDGISFPTLIKPFGVESSAKPLEVDLSQAKEGNFGHYSFAGNLEQNRNYFTTDYDCFFTAINSALISNNLEPIDKTSFRSKISDHMKTAPNIRCSIENSQHKFYSLFGGYGGLLEQKDKKIWDPIRLNRSDHEIEQVINLYGRHERVFGTSSKKGKSESNHSPPKACIRNIPKDKFKQMYEREFGVSIRGNVTEEHYKTFFEKSFAFSMRRTDHRNLGTTGNKSTLRNMINLYSQGDYYAATDLEIKDYIAKGCLRDYQESIIESVKVRHTYGLLDGNQVNDLLQKYGLHDRSAANRPGQSSNSEARRRAKEFINRDPIR